jgi:hypothetical protein
MVRRDLETSGTSSSHQFQYQSWRKPVFPTKKLALLEEVSKVQSVTWVGFSVYPPDDLEYYLLTMIRRYFLKQALSWCDAFRMIYFQSFLIICICLLQPVEMSELQEHFYAGRTNVVKEYNPESDPFSDILAPRVVEFYSPHCVSFLTPNKHCDMIIGGKYFDRCTSPFLYNPSLLVLHLAPTTFKWPKIQRKYIPKFNFLVSRVINTKNCAINTMSKGIRLSVSLKKMMIQRAWGLKESLRVRMPGIRVLRGKLLIFST